MTGKRFTSERTDDYNFSDILDEKGEWIGICHIDSADDFVKKFNELSGENERLKQINSNLQNFRNFITEKNVLNEKQRKELQLQMLRLYNYFENYFEDTMSHTAFSEMWDNVKEDAKWEKKGDDE